jgi:t-SNARE complex subunit (syntaxin)
MSDEDMTTEEHLENIDISILSLSKNINQHLEQMNEYLKYISYAAIIWIMLMIITVLIVVIMMGSLNETVVDAS